MNNTIDLETILTACADDGIDGGIRIDAELEPLGGAGSPVKPAVYEGGVYQDDRRWADPEDAEPTRVIVIDNVPSQANRLEDALRRHRKATDVPEFVLDLSGVSGLPAHLPRRLSSLQFPHRNADAYLRDARLGDTDFMKSEIGKAIFGATAQTCGPLIAWFPQALLYGFWQSHLGKKRANTKHARAWVSEIVGWNPAPADVVRALGLKGDPLNLNTDERINSNPDDRLEWTVGAEAVQGGKKDKLSEIGHGQVPFMGADASASSVSFARVTQRATVSFAQLRRISLGQDRPESDTAARALLVALGLHAHQLAFGSGFTLRSGADLRPRNVSVTWLGASSDAQLLLGAAADSGSLLEQALRHARAAGVPLDGWTGEEVILTPRDNLRKAINATWPGFAD